MPFALVATDDGVTTLDADGTARRALEGRRVSRLVRAIDAVWAVADGGGVLRQSGDGTWDEVVTADAELVCVLPIPGGGLIGTRDGALLRFSDGAVDRVGGFDAVEGRDDWHAVPSGVPYVRSMTATAGAAALCANVHVGGIPRSTDGGETWAPTIDPEIDVHEVRAHPTDPSVVVAAAGYGFAESNDGGATWTLITDGLHTAYARAAAFTSDAALVSVSDGPMASEGSAIYRRVIGGAGPLERCLSGLPRSLAGNIDTGCLDASGEDAVLVDAGGAVFASGDDATTWSHLADIDAGASSIVLAR